MSGVPDLLGRAIGNYRLERLLGSGGMGDVYLGVNPQIGSRVAVKVLHAEHAQDRTHVERFLQEARAVNTIRHDAIVNVLDLGTLPDGRPFLVMEYHDGAVLGQLIRQRGLLPLAGVARVAGDVLDGLAAAHRRLIIHRDLKPDNIWVTLSGRAYVLDFGLAKLAGDKGTVVLTRKGEWLGTPHYMAPEQIDGRKADPRTDLYSVGVILFHACTGRVPFDAPALEEVFRMHLATPAPSPRGLRRDLPPALEALILRALEKDPARRFGSAKEMAAHLRRAAADLPGGEQGLNVADTLGPTAFPFGGPATEAGGWRLEARGAPTPAASGLAYQPSEAGGWRLEARGAPTPAASGLAYQPTVASASAPPAASGLPYQPTVASASAPPASGLAYQPTEAGGWRPEAGIAGSSLQPPASSLPQATLTIGGPLAVAHQPTLPASALAPAAVPATLAGVGPAPFAPAAALPSTAAPAPTRGLSGKAVAGIAVAAVLVIGGIAGTVGFVAGRAGQPEGPAPAAPGVAPRPRGVAGPPAGARARITPYATAAEMPPAKVTKVGNLTLVQTQVSEESLPLTGVDPRRFDALGYRARAHALAATRIKDPLLVGFEVKPVAVDGRVDLTAAAEGEAEYTFRTRAVGAECPVAVVKVTPKAVEVSVNRGESLCKEPARPAWRCSLAQAWQLARRQGAKPVPAKVSWLADGWFFDLDDEGSESVRDTCR